MSIRSIPSISEPRRLRSNTIGLPGVLFQSNYNYGSSYGCLVQPGRSHSLYRERLATHLLFG